VLRLKKAMAVSNVALSITAQPSNSAGHPLAGAASIAQVKDTAK
jgi:hypothetical protein